MKSVLGTGLTVVLGLIPICCGAPGSTRQVTAEQSQPADDFVDSIGVNTHLGYIDGTWRYFNNYADPVAPGLPSIKQLILDLGVRHVRDDLNNYAPKVYENMSDLAHSGIGFSFVTFYRALTPQQIKDKIHLLGAVHVDALEGLNEPQGFAGAGWQEKTAEDQKTIFDLIKGSPEFKGIRVYGPSVIHPNIERLPDISSLMDAGNIHSYYGGEQPETEGFPGAPVVTVQGIRYRYQSLLYCIHYMGALISKDLPVAATETGLNNATATSVTTGNGFPYTPLDISAWYIPRQFLYYFNVLSKAKAADGKLLARTYLYELMDTGTNLRDLESNYGLVTNNGVPKPAYYALQNLIALLADPGSNLAKTDSLSFNLGGDTANVMHTLLQKRNGEFYLAIWNASSAWDENGKARRALDAKAVTLTLQSPFKFVQVAAPSRSRDWKPIVPGPNNTYTIQVGPEVSVVRLCNSVPAPTPVPKDPMGGAHDVLPIETIVPSGHTFQEIAQKAASEMLSSAKEVAAAWQAYAFASGGSHAIETSVSGLYRTLVPKYLAAVPMFSADFAKMNNGAPYGIKLAADGTSGRYVTDSNTLVFGGVNLTLCKSINMQTQGSPYIPRDPPGTEIYAKASKGFCAFDSVSNAYYFFYKVFP